ncbi:MAG: UDP-N-acetylmuramate dehydrogenase [Patescibacteria group bacterium]|jgi:UDP-N-acetylmuramate dehydrogenase
MINEKIQKDVVLAPFTTFKIGGPARFLVEVKTREDLAEAVKWARDKEQPTYYLGGGSNLLITDEGFPGLVIRLANREAIIKGDRLYCGAGASLAYCISLSRGANLSGLEWGFGIPLATIGGSVRGNAGAFGASIGEIVETVEYFNVKKEKFEFLSRNDCDFDYRNSIFKKNLDMVVWNIVLRLKPATAEEISANIESNLTHRDKGQPKLPSAGSVFKNLFLNDILQVNPSLIEFINEQGVAKGGKIGAGYFIDLRGLKGKTIGGAKISLEHANFIVNTGRATAKDVLELIEFVKKEIELRFKIKLEEEIVILK